MNYVVRNADCHAKNIALFYTERGNVSYTPVYDIVTTQAYPLFADNPPGLSVGGRKTWAPGKSLEVFLKGRLGIAPRDYKEMVERLCESAVETGKEVIAAAKQNPAWHDSQADAARMERRHGQPTKLTLGEVAQTAVLLRALRFVSAHMR